MISGYSTIEQNIRITIQTDSFFLIAYLSNNVSIISRKHFTNDTIPCKHAQKQRFSSIESFSREQNIDETYYIDRKLLY